MNDESATRVKDRNLPVQRMRERLSEATRRLQKWRRERWWKIPTAKNGVKWRNFSGEKVLVSFYPDVPLAPNEWACEINNHIGFVYGVGERSAGSRPLDAALTAAYLWMDCRIPQRTNFDGRPFVPVRDGRPVRDGSAETYLYLDNRKDIGKLLCMIRRQEEIVRLKGERP